MIKYQGGGAWGAERPPIIVMELNYWTTIDLTNTIRPDLYNWQFSRTDGYAILAKYNVKLTELKCARNVGYSEVIDRLYDKLPKHEEYIRLIRAINCGLIYLKPHYFGEKEIAVDIVLLPVSAMGYPLVFGSTAYHGVYYNKRIEEFQDVCKLVINGKITDMSKLCGHCENSVQHVAGHCELASNLGSLPCKPELPSGMNFRPDGIFANDKYLPKELMYMRRPGTRNDEAHLANFADDKKTALEYQKRMKESAKQAGLTRKLSTRICKSCMFTGCKLRPQTCASLVTTKEAEMLVDDVIANHHTNLITILLRMSTFCSVTAEEVNTCKVVGTNYTVRAHGLLFSCNEDANILHVQSRSGVHVELNLAKFKLTDSWNMFIGDAARETIHKWNKESLEDRVRLATIVKLTANSSYDDDPKKRQWLQDIYEHSYRPIAKLVSNKHVAAAINMIKPRTNWEQLVETVLVTKTTNDVAEVVNTWLK